MTGNLVYAKRAITMLSSFKWKKYCYSKFDPHRILTRIHLRELCKNWESVEFFFIKSFISHVKQVIEPVLVINFVNEDSTIFTLKIFWPQKHLKKKIVSKIYRRKLESSPVDQRSSSQFIWCNVHTGNGVIWRNR